MNLLSTKEAAEKKGTSLQVILGAVKRGEIDVIKVGGVHLVKANKKFQQWEKSEQHSKAVQVRWAKEKKKKTSKRDRTGR
jgi:hypothetical protein